MLTASAGIAEGHVIDIHAPEAARAKPAPAAAQEDCPPWLLPHSPVWLARLRYLCTKEVQMSARQC